MSIRNWLAQFFATSILAASLTACAAISPPQPTSTIPIVPEFQVYYAAHGGERTLGLPISSATVVGEVTTQYFVSGCLQYYPQLPASQQVIPCALPSELRQGQPPIDSSSVSPSALYFTETGHAIQGAFRGFFEEYGGVGFFGYPISGTMVRNESQLMQYFERAILVWDRTLLPAQAVQLVPVGSFAYERLLSVAPTNSFGLAEQILRTASAVNQAIMELVKTHGGQAVFGPQLTEPRVAADKLVEQVFANAVVVEDPTAPEGARLRPLGLRAYGRIDPPASRMNVSDAIYFAQTGHNVLPAFGTFYHRHGGENVFGLPISEMFIEDAAFVQYFHNAVLAWEPVSAGATGTQLKDLGRQYLHSTQATVDAADGEPVQQAQEIVAVTWTRYPFARPGDKQEIQVAVLGQDGKPVEGAMATIELRTSEGPAVFVLPVTGTDGRATLNFPVEILGADQQGAVEYKVHVQVEDLELTLVHGFDLRN